MLKRIKLIGIIGIVWVIFFQLTRALFFAYQYHTAQKSYLSTMILSGWHGLKMDTSFSAYLLVLPTLLMAFTARHWSWYAKFLNYYNLTISALIALIITVDLEVFKSWGFRLDSTPLHYLNHPTEAAASTASAPVLLLLGVWVILSVFFYFSLRKVTNYTIADFSWGPQFSLPPIFIILTGILIIPIRGGLQLAPMNESSVYYSSDNFANQLAINPAWNFFSSVFNTSILDQNPFEFIDEKEAEKIVTVLSTKYTDTKPELIADSSTNVIILIWESFTAKVVRPLGGLPGITPQFELLAREGILFSNLYASGDRSDKGLVSILSGYPAQPITSIIKLPTKTAHLPSLPHEFKSKGYSTSFYYGGETEFANIKSYLLQDRFEEIIDKSSFAKKDMNSKWGAHDHVVLNRLLEDLDQKKSPFFTTLFTLSSHEPFEVPVKTEIHGDDNESLFLNSLHYTDASIGDFIKKAKTKPWWDNTIVIIIADHGHPMPNTASGKASQFHIPMLWLGGALKKKGIVYEAVGSQVDLAATLLEQFGFTSETFKWSQDLFNPKRTPFAFYSFNNGFGFMKTDGYLAFDNVGRIEIERGGKITDRDKLLGRAYQQSLFDDFLSR